MHAAKISSHQLNIVMLPYIVIDFFLNNQPDALIFQIYCYKTPHVSAILSAHHQEFSTVHSALVSFMQVFDERFQAESEWNCVDYFKRNIQKRFGQSLT
jgi:hypothetical protein